MKIRDKVGKTLSEGWNDPAEIRKVINILPGHKYLNRREQIQRKILYIEKHLPELQEVSRKKGQESRKILDVSCGAGTLIEVFNALGHRAQGTERPATPFKGLHRSQGIKVSYFDSACIPFPFKDTSFDVVTCIGAINFYKPIPMWPYIVGDFFRLSREIVLVHANIDIVWNTNKGFLTRLSPPKGWELEIAIDGLFKWRKR